MERAEGRMVDGRARRVKEQEGLGKTRTGKKVNFQNTRNSISSRYSQTYFVSLFSKLTLWLHPNLLLEHCLSFFVCGIWLVQTNLPAGIETELRATRLCLLFCRRE